MWILTPFFSDNITVEDNLFHISQCLLYQTLHNLFLFEFSAGKTVPLEEC